MLEKGTAQELKNQFIKKKMQNKVGVIAIGKNEQKETYWWHVRNEEKLPENKDIAFHIRGEQVLKQ